MKKDDYIKTYQWMNALRGGVLRDVYALLYQLGQKGDVKVTIAYLCDRLGYKERSVRGSINDLIENGCIEVEYSDGKCSSYKVLKTEDLETQKSATKKASDPCKICIPDPCKICSTAKSAPLQNLHDTPAKFAYPTPYLLSLDKNLDKNYSSSSSVGTRAREQLQKWFEESDLKEWILRLEKTHAITLETDTLLNDFFDNDFQVREECERGERTAVLKHFQNWLPKYLRILKEQNNQPSTPNTQPNGNAKSNRNGSGISPADFASTFSAGFLAGGGKLR